MFAPRIQRLSRIAAGVAAAVSIAAAAPAAASATTTTTPCATQVTAPVFALWGDLRDYYLAPGGAFEGQISWAKSGDVSLSSANEPWLLAGVTHRSSAKLGAGGTVTSPKLCVTRDEPDMRFFGRHLGGGQLDVTVRVHDANGNVTNSSSGSVSPGDHVAWAPSDLIDLKTDHLEPGEAGYVTVSFRSQGSWLVDDVFIDPYRR